MMKTLRGTTPGPRADLLLVVNQYEHTVSFIDPRTRQEIAEVAVGVNGHEAAISPDGEVAYVPIYGNAGVGKPGTDGSSIDILSIRERRVVGHIALGRPTRPHLAVFGADGLLYVTAELAEAVDVIVPRSGKIVASIPTGASQSHMLALAPDGRRAYTANINAGSVSVLDLVARKLAAVIPVAKRVQRLTISADGRRVYTHDQGAPRVAVLDTATNIVADWLEVPDVPYASALTPDGRCLLVALRESKQVAVVDLQAGKVARILDVAGRPMQVLVIPQEGAPGSADAGASTAYVSCLDSGVIEVLDLPASDPQSWRAVQPIRLKPGLDGMAWVRARASRD